MLKSTSAYCLKRERRVQNNKFSYTLVWIIKSSGGNGGNSFQSYRSFHNLCQAQVENSYISGVDALLAAPGAFVGLGHSCGCDHSRQLRRRRPCPPVADHGLNINAPGCSVPVPTPTSLETNCTSASSNGNNGATAWSMNVCPYLVNFCPSSPPPGSWLYVL